MAFGEDLLKDGTTPRRIPHDPDIANRSRLDEGSESRGGLLVRGERIRGSNKQNIQIICAQTLQGVAYRIEDGAPTRAKP